MTKKITILFEAKRQLADQAIQELQQNGWEIYFQDLAAVNMAKKFWLKFWDSIFFDLATSQFATGLPEFLSRWFTKQLIRPRVKTVLDSLRRLQPPIVLVTSLTAGLVMNSLKDRRLYRGKVVYFFEGFSFNPLAVLNNIDIYLCRSERQVELLKQMQIDSSRCILIKPDVPTDFFAQMNKEQVIPELGLLSTMPTVMLMTEYDGADILRESFLRMIRSSTSFQVVVFCKENSEIKARLEKITAPVRHPVRFITNFSDLHRWYSAVDIVVGPLNDTRLAEAAASKVPIVICDPKLYGSDSDLRFLLEQNLLAIGRIPAEVVFLIESTLENRRITNTSLAQEVLADPKSSLRLSDALASINPASTNDSKAVIASGRKRNKAMPA